MVLTREENELITRVGPGTPMGEVLRRYWMPALLSSELPGPEWMRTPDAHRRVSVTYEYANFVQCVEGGIDTSHSSFAHNNDLSDKKDLTNSATAPLLEVTKTNFGFQYASIRDINPEQNYIRLYTFVMPFHQIRSQQIVRRGGAGTRPEAP